MVSRLSNEAVEFHYLCYFPGLCKSQYLSHHVAIVFLRRQAIAECWTTWLFIHDRNSIGRNRTQKSCHEMGAVF